MAQRRQLKSVLKARFRNIICNGYLPPDPAGASGQFHPLFDGTNFDDVPYVPGDPGPSADKKHPNFEMVEADLAGLWMDFDRICGGACNCEVAGPEKVESRRVGLHTVWGGGINVRDVLHQSRERNSAGQYSPLAKISMEEWWMREGQRKRASAESGGASLDELPEIKNEDSSGEDVGGSEDSEDDEAAEDLDAAPVRRGAAAPVIAALKGRRKAVLRIFAQMGHVVEKKKSNKPEDGQEGERFLDLGLRGSEDYHLFYKSMVGNSAPGRKTSDPDLGLRGSFTHLADKPSPVNLHTPRRFALDAPPPPFRKMVDSEIAILYQTCLKRQY